MKLRAHLLLLATLAFFAFAITACDEDDDTPPAGPQVYIYHASPNAPAIDIFINGELSAVQGLAYGSGSNGYLSLEAGDAEVAISPAGLPADSAVLSTTLSLENGKSYSVFAHGVLDSTSIGSLTLLALEDDLSAPEAGNAHIRVLHLSHNAPSVDVLALESLGDRNGTAVEGFTGLSYPSNTAFSPLAAGDYILGLGAAGDSRVAYQIGATPLEDGGIYTAIASGDFAAAPGAAGRFRVSVVRNR